MALSCKAVLKVLLSVRCYPCGYDIVYLSMLMQDYLYLLLGRLKYNRLYNLTWGGPEKWQKWGRPIRVLSHFWHVNSKMFVPFLIVPLSL